MIPWWPIRLAIALASAVLAVGAALYLALASYPLGLDFEGGLRARLTLRSGDPVHARELLRRRLPDDAVVTIAQDDALIVNLPRAAALPGNLGSSAQLAMYSQAPGADDYRRDLAREADAPGAFTPPPGTRLFRDPHAVHLVTETPALTGIDFLDARYVQDDAQPHVVLDLSPEGSERFANVTAAHVGEVIVLALDERVLFAPIVMEAIHSESVHISLGHPEEDTEALVAELRAATGPDVELDSVRVIGSALPATLGKPPPTLLALLAAFVAVLVALLPRHPALAAVPALLLAPVFVEVFLLLPGGTLSMVTHGAALVSAVPAALAAVAVARYPGGVPDRWTWILLAPTALFVVILPVVPVIAPVGSLAGPIARQALFGLPALLVAVGAAGLLARR